MGKMNKGTVSWLNKASAENILLAVRCVSWRIANTQSVTKVTMMDEMWVSSAETEENIEMLTGELGLIYKLFI